MNKPDYLTPNLRTNCITRTHKVKSTKGFTLKLTPARQALTDQARADLHTLITPRPVGEPLLVTLATLIGSSVGFAEGSSGTKLKNASNLLDLSAWELMEWIRKIVAAEIDMPATEHSHQARLGNQLRLMLGPAEADQRDDKRLTDAAGILKKAVEAIHEVMDPTPEIDLPGTCPVCKTDRVIIDSGIKPAIGLRRDVATCRFEECTAEWIGIEELRRLSAHLHGGTVIALDSEKRRLAEMDAAAEAAQALRAA